MTEERKEEKNTERPNKLLKVCGDALCGISIVITALVLIGTPQSPGLIGTYILGFDSNTASPIYMERINEVCTILREMLFHGKITR